MPAKRRNQILMYVSPDGETRVDVLYEDETVWLSQAQMSELFHTERSVISKHINNIYRSEELDQESTCAIIAQVQNEGDRRVERPVQYYNLDVIIAVGYRVNSRRGTQFRIWATRSLAEYARKGFVIDDDRLEHGGSRYFDELVERVRRIRTSEANFYHKVRQIFATSMDYEKDGPAAQTFFAAVQNKFHYAIHGHTAAELIMERVGSDRLNLGLSNWRKGEFTLQDAFVAKNYLTQTELKRLELLVEQFLSFAELRYLEQQSMTMNDWIQKLDQFIGQLNEKPVLTNAGVVSRQDMEQKVREEYEAYKERVLAERSLSEEKWNSMLEDAARYMLLPPQDDIEDSGIDPEYVELRQAESGDLINDVIEPDAPSDPGFGNDGTNVPTRRGTTQSPLKPRKRNNPKK